jgi:hypothetical protein
MRLTLAILTLLLLAPAGDAAWTGQDLGGAHRFVDGTGLTVSSDGRALATWSFADAVGNASRLGASSASRPPGGDAFGAPRALVPRTAADRRSTTVEGVAAFGASSALVATTRQVGTGPQPRVRLEVRTGATDGSFGKPVAIRTQRGLRSVSLSVNGRGDAALAWFEDRGVNTDRVYVALRRAGHRFGAPRRLATGRIRSTAASIGARGDVLVAWDARGTLRARVKPRTRARFHATDTIRSKPAYFAEMAPVVTPSGRAVLAWSAQFASEGGDRGPVYVQAAIRPAGARRFRRAQELVVIPAGIYDGLGRGVDAVVDSTGHAVVAYNGGETTRRIPHMPHDKPVLLARDAGGRRGLVGIGQASGEGEVAVLSDLAAGPGGRLVVVWDGGVDDPQSVVRAAIADGAGAGFGPPEDVSATDEEARFGHAAFLGERPVVVLSSRAVGGGDPVARAYVR